MCGNRIGIRTKPAVTGTTGEQKEEEAVKGVAKVSGETREHHHRSQRKRVRVWLMMSNAKRGQVLRLEMSPMI